MPLQNDVESPDTSLVRIFLDTETIEVTSCSESNAFEMWNAQELFEEPRAGKKGGKTVLKSRSLIDAENELSKCRHAMFNDVEDGDRDTLCLCRDDCSAKVTGFGEVDVKEPNHREHIRCDGTHTDIFETRWRTAGRIDIKRLICKGIDHIPSSFELELCNFPEDHTSFLKEPLRHDKPRTVVASGTSDGAKVGGCSYRCWRMNVEIGSG